MPVFKISKTAENKKAGGAKQTGFLTGSKLRNDTIHQENLAPAGYVSEEFWALVHAPISIDKALQTPAARQTLEKGMEKARATEGVVTQHRARVRRRRVGSAC